MDTNKKFSQILSSVPPSFRASVMNHSALNPRIKRYTARCGDRALHHAPRTLIFTLLMLFIFLASGCGTRLSYKLPIKGKPTKYYISVSRGDIHTTPKKEEKKTTAITKSAYYLTARPSKKQGGKTWVEIKAEPRREDNITAGADLGTETIVIDRKGNISDRYGIRIPLEIEFLFPPLPKNNVKPDDTWKIKKQKNMAGTVRETDWTYKYLGSGKGQKQRCQNVSLSIQHTEKIDQQMPGGIALNILVKYYLNGDICMSGGKVSEAKYEEKFYVSLANPELSKFHMEKNSYTDYTIKEVDRIK